MIVIYIIIGYLISVGLSIISDILLILLLDDNDDKKRLKNAATIGDFLNEINPISFIPIINTFYCICAIFLILVVFCFSNILLGSLTLLYERCEITKLTILWNKFLNIRIRKNKQE